MYFGLKSEQYMISFFQKEGYQALVCTQHNEFYSKDYVALEIMYRPFNKQT